MNMQAAQRDWLQDTVAANAAVTAGASLPWLDRARADAREALKTIKLPDRKQEAWRYADLGKLYRQSYHYQADALTTLQARDLRLVARSRSVDLQPRIQPPAGFRERPLHTRIIHRSRTAARHQGRRPARCAGTQPRPALTLAGAKRLAAD